MTEETERFDEMTGPIDAHTPPSDGEEMAAIDGDIHDLKVLAVSMIDRIKSLEMLVAELVAATTPKS